MTELDWNWSDPGFSQDLWGKVILKCFKLHCLEIPEAENCLRIRVWKRTATSNEIPFWIAVFIPQHHCEIIWECRGKTVPGTTQWREGCRKILVLLHCWVHWDLISAKCFKRKHREMHLPCSNVPARWDKCRYKTKEKTWMRMGKGAAGRQGR